MKIIDINMVPPESISHDPALKKKVLLRATDTLGELIGLSHIAWQKGDSASEHVHDELSEIFVGLSGEFEFTVEGQRVVVKEDTVLVVEPGEKHSVSCLMDNSKMMYLHVG